MLSFSRKKFREVEKAKNEILNIDADTKVLLRAVSQAKEVLLNRLASDAFCPPEQEERDSNV